MSFRPLFDAGPNSIVARAASSNFDFLGVASGANVYLLPSSPVAGVPYLGFNGLSVPNGIFARYQPVDSRISSANAYMKIQLVAMRTSSGGHASIYSIFSGHPRVQMLLFIDLNYTKVDVLGYELAFVNTLWDMLC